MELLAVYLRTFITTITDLVSEGPVMNEGLMEAPRPWLETTMNPNPISLFEYEKKPKSKDQMIWV
jgi:hypothetical protein